MGNVKTVGKQMRNKFDEILKHQGGQRGKHANHKTQKQNQLFALEVSLNPCRYLR